MRYVQRHPPSPSHHSNGPYPTPGTHALQLQLYTSRLTAFHALHPLEAGSGALLFNQQLLAWHRDFLDLQVLTHKAEDSGSESL